MDKTKYLILLALAACMLIFGCENYKPSDSSILISILLSSPDKIEINNREFTLETYLWRDFMPFSPPNGKPLIALIRVTATDLLEFPSSVDANRLWVIYNDKEVWETDFSSEDVPNLKHQLAKIAREGPKWGPGIQVDVVVRIIDGENSIYLLKASNQSIYRTD